MDRGVERAMTSETEGAVLGNRSFPGVVTIFSMFKDTYK